MTLKDPSKPARDCSGPELRNRARGDEYSLETRSAANAEMGRRRDNLRGAIIPCWEYETRGPDPARWDLSA